MSMPTSLIIRFNCYQLKRFINSKANVYSFCSYGSAILILSRFVTREFISPVRLYIRVLSCIIYQLSEIFSPTHPSRYKNYDSAWSFWFILSGYPVMSFIRMCVLYSSWLHSVWWTYLEWLISGLCNVNVAIWCFHQ